MSSLSHSQQAQHASTSSAASAATAAAVEQAAASLNDVAFSSKTIVIKLGTSSILSEATSHPRLGILSGLVETCLELRTKGHKVVIVCSGAIGMGRVRMGIKERPKTLGERQALAALGQLRLIALWDRLFDTVDIPVAQVLLTRNDIADRPRYLNARTTLHTLLSPRFNAIPIVNENDTVSVSELRFGDNDTLSAITAGLVDADYLFLCTDVDGLYTGNPRSDPTARRLGVVGSVLSARKAVSVATPGSSFGTGGMQTKLIAAELATAAGVATVILNGHSPDNIVRIVEQGLPPLSPHLSAGAEDLTNVGSPSLDDPPHTLFLPTPNPMPSRKWSILHALHPSGTLIIDEGAHRRIARHDSGGRLLPAGLVGVEGTWERMQAVRLVVRRRRRPHHAGYEESESDAHMDERSVPSPLQLRHLKSYLRNRTSAPGTPASTSGGDMGLGAFAPPEASTPADSGPPSGAVTPPVIDALRTPLMAIAAASTAATSDTPTNGLSAQSGSARADSSDPANETGAEAEPEWELVEIGRALANYNSIESERIKGIKSSQITAALGYADSDYVTDQIALHPPALQVLLSPHEG